MLCYEQALLLDDTRWRARLSYVSCLEDVGRIEQAAAQYYLTIATAGEDAKDLANVHRSIGRTRLHIGRPGCAIECFRRSLEFARQVVDDNAQKVVAHTLIELGDALAQVGLVREARCVFDEVLLSDDDYAHERAARIAFRSGLYDSAFAALRREAELKHDRRSARYLLVRMMVDSGALTEAMNEIEESASDLSLHETELNGSIAAKTGDTARAFKIYESRAKKGFTAVTSDAATMSLYSEHLNPAEISDLHVELLEFLNTWIQRREPFPNNPDPERQIRVGFMTSDLRRESRINELMQPILRRLDPRLFHTTFYKTGAAYDAETRRAISQVDAWRPIPAIFRGEFRRRVEEDRIDIMVDLAGHTNHNAMVLIFQNLAPVQTTYLGYPGTTGVPNMGWIIADNVVAPPEHDELYSEKVVRLPNTVFCYAPDADYQLPDFTDRYRDRPLTFGSFNDIESLTMSTVRLWSRVLKRVAESRLLLACKGLGDPGVVNRYKDLFENEGIGFEQLILRGERPLLAMMSEYASIDIGLDPVPVTGGVTTLQAMWMGVPVVTKRGGNFSQRMGASFMNAAGLDDWIADDDDAYIEIAAAKAQDRAALLSLKRGLRERLLARPAWDIDRYTRDFEAALRHMWREWCASQS